MQHCSDNTMSACSLSTMNCSPIAENSSADRFYHRTFAIILLEEQVRLIFLERRYRLIIQRGFLSYKASLVTFAWSLRDIPRIRSCLTRSSTSQKAAWRGTNVSNRKHVLPKQRCFPQFTSEDYLWECNPILAFSDASNKCYFIFLRTHKLRLEWFWRSV